MNDGLKDRASRWWVCAKDLPRCVGILCSGRDVDGGPLPLRDRLHQVWTRLRYLRGATARNSRRGRWRWLLLGLLLVLTNPFVTEWADGWGLWWQVALIAATIITAGFTAVSWYRHLRHNRHRAFWLLGGLSFHVVVLGIIAMRDCFSGRIPGIAHLYHSLLLFTGTTSTEGCPTVTLGTQLAEIGGITVLFATAFTVINEIGSGPIARWRAGIASNVILVTGLSDDSLPVIRALTEDSDDSIIVVVEPNPDHPLIQQARRYGAHVIRAEISARQADRKWLRSLCTSWGRHVSLRRAYLLSDDEQVNLRAATVIREVLADLGPAYRDEHRAPTRLIVRIDRYRPARHHAADQASGWGASDQPAHSLHSGPGAFISTLGTTQVTAHALAEHIATRGRSQHVIVVGESDLSHAFHDEWRLRRDSARFLRDAMTRQPSWRNELEQLTELPEPLPLDTIPDAQHLAQLCDEDPVSVILAQEPDETGRSRLENLAVGLTGHQVQIFIPTPGVRGLADTPLLGCLRPFGLSLGGGVVEQAEKNGSTQPTPLHGVPQDSWFRAAKLAADSYGINDERSSWAGLTATDRDSNLRAAWSLLTWLAELGYTWSTTRPDDHKHPSDDFLSLLVPLEHLAWMTFKLDTGWVGSDGDTNDRDRRLNRFLHPLDELDDTRRKEAVRNTRDNLRHLLEIFTIFGFHTVAPRQEHDHWWRFRRVSTVKLLETLTESKTWLDGNGNELTAAPGDLWIADDTEPPSNKRSITVERFNATHRHIEGDRYRRTGTCRARVAAAGERIDSREGRQTAGPDSWVVTDSTDGRWIITSAALARGYVIEGAVDPAS